MFNNFYRDKTFLVTGVSGVKGTWLALQLLEAGSRVIGLDLRRPEAESNFRASALDDRITFVHGDVTDLTLLQKSMEGVDGVFHLAAISLVVEARRQPFETYRSNVMGTVAVLEALRRSPSVRRAVIVTTDKVYKPKAGELWIENDPLGATEPYPVSKSCAEYVVADYYRQYLKPMGTHVAVGRAGNVVLGGDPYSSAATNGAGHLHVDCFDALAHGRQPEVYTPGFTRPYTYGLDILAGYMSLMSRLDEPGVDGEPFNFGPCERYGVENGRIATLICDLWGSGLTWKTTVARQEPFERQSISWDKAEQRLGWRPAFTVEEFLKEVAQWYRAWHSGGHRGNGAMAEINRSLIEAHGDAARRQGIWWSVAV